MYVYTCGSLKISKPSVLCNCSPSISMNTIRLISKWPRYYAHNVHLQQYVNWVKTLSKRDLGNPFHPHDQPDNFLPSPLKEAYRNNSTEYHIKNLVTFTQQCRMRPCEVKGKSVFSGRFEWESDYHVRGAMSAHFPNSETCTETLALQHAMSALFNKLEEINH